MLPDWVSNPGPLTYESGALPIALRGPALLFMGQFTGNIGNTAPNHCTVTDKGCMAE